MRRLLPLLFLLGLGCDDVDAGGATDTGAATDAGAASDASAEADASGQRGDDAGAPADAGASGGAAFDATPGTDARPTDDAEPRDPDAAAPPPLQPPRMGIAGLYESGNVVSMAERGDIEWSLLRRQRQADGTLDVDAILADVDCLVLPGGADIDPARYGEDPHPTVNLISDARDEFDFAVLEEALGRRMPILGLCLGGQELTVALGGRLVQDIPSEVPGALDHRALHPIEIVPGTLMDEMYAVDMPVVYSNHHQAAEDGDGLGEGLRVSARSEDGVVEAFEAIDRASYPFLFGTQYHPELQLESGQHDGLIQRFREACLAYQVEHPRGPSEPDTGGEFEEGPCHSEVGPGVCLPDSDCAGLGGEAAPGMCAADLTCCSAVPCINLSGDVGECVASDLCDQQGRLLEPGLCPGNSDVQCCFGPATCRLDDGAAGTCRDVAACDAAGGRRESGHCPGPAAIQCCVD